MERLRVVVLTGGTSAEREICLKSGRKVLEALDPARYEAVAVDLAAITGGRASEVARAFFQPDGGEAKALPGEGAETEAGAKVAAMQPAGREAPPARLSSPADVVFIALHGGAGENGTVQGMLELLGIPHTGSGVLASALAMDKIMSKKMFEREGIPTPKWVPLRASDRASAGRLIASEVGFPCVVKPACQGSTIGVSVVRNPEGLPAALELAFQYGPEALAEEYIEGTEISAGILGNEEAQVLPLVEIVPASGFYDYEAKYTPGATEEIIPARIPKEVAERAGRMALAAHRALGCRGFSRVDAMVRGDEVVVLEVNSIPGLTETSIVPRAAEAAGMSFAQLAERLIELALEEHGRGGKGGST